MGDTVILFTGEIQETDPTSATATTIQLARESLEEPLNEMRPMIMVDGILYLDTNKAVSEVIDDFSVLGEVSSSLSGSKKPTENGQTNFDKAAHQTGTAPPNTDTIRQMHMKTLPP